MTNSFWSLSFCL